MGRTATNVIGNSLATAVIGRWEGETAETIGSTSAAAQAA
jgi:Na+/H+-dicarboxylate symporter